MFVRTHSERYTGHTSIGCGSPVFVHTEHFWYRLCRILFTCMNMSIYYSLHTVVI